MRGPWTDPEIPYVWNFSAPELRRYREHFFKDASQFKVAAPQESGGQEDDKEVVAATRAMEEKLKV